MFRDWLKTHPEDREIYAASLEAGETGHQYNARKNDVIRKSTRASSRPMD
jgi:GrpB-like predicted nucleotidyltransferase (UPF0157 family)